MSAAWEKQTLATQLRDTILALCKAHPIYGGHMEIDAIICVSGKSEGQDLVVKVHERLGNGSGRLALTDFLTRPRDGWPQTALSNSTNTTAAATSQSDSAEDYSLKRPRLDDSYKSSEADSYPNLKQHLMNPSQRPRDLREIQEIRSREVSAAKDLTMALNAEEESAPTSPLDYTSPAVSPGGADRESSRSPGAFASQFPYSSTPHSIFQKRIPLRNDRWSPNHVIPTVPECKPCGYNFRNLDLLSDHNEAVHSVFTCQSCMKTFTSRSNLERHSRLHTGHRPYNCNICGKSFSRKDHLSNHATKHAYKCGTCSKRFSDKKQLVAHYSYDHSAILTNICEMCNKGFSSNEQYDEHVRLHPQCNGLRDDDDAEPQNLSTSATPTDTPTKKFTCRACGFCTADRLTLVKHQIIHQENTRCYTCLSCAKMFEDPLHYSDHLLVHPSETNIFECCICRHICPTLPSLRRHEATHLSLPLLEEAASPTPTFPCPKCDKTFATEYILEEHMDFHDRSESAFTCSVCHEEFETYSAICNHIEQEAHYAQPESSRENGAAEPATPKNKRKQKLPQSVKTMQAMEQESDVEIVEPESPDDGMTDEVMTNGSAAYITHTNNGEFVVTENPARVIEIVPEGSQDPIKSLLSQRIEARNRHKLEADSQAIADLIQKPKRSKNRSPEKSAAANTETNNNSTSSNNNILLSPKLMNVEIPDGPFHCSICSHTVPTFQELEMHCFSEHNRSPCMFCAKTFAQKANRDRHVCLHTGEKPYACPDCSEKFSRGDKLKIHRMRAHQTAFPSVAAKGPKDRELSVSPSASPGAEAYRGGDVYSAADWAVKREAAANDYVAATGEWSVREVDDSGIDNGNDVSMDDRQ